MTALHFGRPEAPLFGVYHPAVGRRRGTAGIVICNAFGAEYMLSHFALRRVALELAKGGHEVLRFDYSGTGDSSGHEDDVSLGQWLEDIDTAIDELIDTAGLDAVSLLGVRLGAGLACVAAAKHGETVRSVVAWDPVLRGEHYLAELRRVERIMQSGESGEPQLLGHPLPETFRAELKGFDAAALAVGLGDRLIRINEPSCTEGRRMRPGGLFEQALVTGDIIVDHQLVDEVVAALVETSV